MKYEYEYKPSKYVYECGSVSTIIFNRIHGKLITDTSRSVVTTVILGRNSWTGDKIAKGQKA